jgi:transcriptional regulator with XRE-family HTH domain
LETTRELNRRFGLCLKELRYRARFSLRELGELAGIDHAYLHRLENGIKYHPSDDLVRRLHRILKQRGVKEQPK